MYDVADYYLAQPMIDFSKLISLSYWFDTRPTDLSPSFELLFVVILIASYALFAVTKIIINQQRQKKLFLYVRFYNRVANLWLTLAVTFTFIFFFRYEGIPLLGARFWFLFWIIGGGAWGIHLYRYYRSELPKLMRERQDYREFAKYLPKKK